MRDLLIEYEMYLLDKIECVPEYHFRDVGKLSIEQTVASLIKYVTENIMHWTPEEAYHSLTWKILIDFKLDDIIEKNIEFMPGMNEKEKCNYLIHKCYPAKFRFDFKRCVLRIYGDILSEKKPKWNKKFFNGQEGAIRACICMQAAINRYLYGLSIEELYSYFGNNYQGIKFIKAVKLKKAYEKLYNLPIDFFHYSLPKNQRNDFLFNYYHFMNYYEQENKTHPNKNMQKGAIDDPITKKSNI